MASPVKKPLIDALAGVYLQKLKTEKCSSPTPGTSQRIEFKGVTIQVAPSTDISRTLDYRPPKLYDAGGDVTKQWHVRYSYRHPKTGKMERFKVYRDINLFETKTERIHYGRALIAVYKELLRAGYSPFDNYVNPTTGDISDNILDCITLYLSEKKKSVATGTYKSYKVRLGHFEKWIEDNKHGHLKIGEIKKNHITKFLSTYQEQESWENTTRNNIKGDLASFFSYFIKNFDDVLDKNPVTGMDDLPESPTGNTAFTDDQVSQLLKVMQEDNPYLRFFCEFVYETCTRPQAEARLVQIEDFDFTGRQLKIWSDTAKTNVSRFIPLSDAFMAKIRAYVDGYPGHYYLFTRYRRPGEKPMIEETIQNWFTKAKEKVGLDKRYNIYSWKHTKNIHVYRQTKDIYFVKELNGHASLEATAKYLRDLGLFVDLNQVANSLKPIF